MLKVYYDLMSQPSRAVVLFLKCNNISYTDCPVALRKGEQLTDEYAKINPMQKVPAIDHDGFKLSESVAILRYLSTTFNVVDHWLPKEPRLQARVDEFMAWQHLNLRTFGSMYFQTKVIRKPFKADQLERWKGDLDKCLDHLQNVWLAKSDWINGLHDISIADLLAVCELEQPIIAGYDICKDRPVLKAYMQRVQTRLQPHYREIIAVGRKVQEMVAKM